jgi:acyl carrier protein
MSKQDQTIIAREIKEFILQEFLVGANPDELTEDTPLIDSGIVDSMAMIKLVVFIEDRFGKTIDVDAEKLSSIQNIARAIESN